MTVRKSRRAPKHGNPIPLPDHRLISQELLSANAKQITYPANTSIFQQGAQASAVFFILKGQVHISIVSKQGKQGVIALPLAPGDFFGESSLTTQRLYLASASTVTASEVVKIPRETMAALLRTNSVVGAAFTAFLLQHSLDIEAELIDHLFNSSEKRLARTLLLLANFGHEGQLEPIANMTQELLAQRVGTTRGRISFFMNKFRRLGLIDYNGTIRVHSGLLGIVLHDSRLSDDKEPAQAAERQR